jgi:hypothetical protein
VIAFATEECALELREAFEDLPEGGEPAKQD